MSTKHTPGPWEVFEYNSEDTHGADGIRSTSRKESRNVLLPDQGISGKDVEEAIANARLIAVAPELLEALIDAHAKLANILSDREAARGIGMHFAGVQACAASALALIAKAEGKQ